MALPILYPMCNVDALKPKIEVAKKCQFVFGVDVDSSIKLQCRDISNIKFSIPIQQVLWDKMITSWQKNYLCMMLETKTEIAICEIKPNGQEWDVNMGSAQRPHVSKLKFGAVVFGSFAVGLGTSLISMLFTQHPLCVGASATGIALLDVGWKMWQETNVQRDVWLGHLVQTMFGR